MDRRQRLGACATRELAADGAPAYSTVALIALLSVAVIVLLVGSDANRFFMARAQ